MGERQRAWKRCLQVGFEELNLPTRASEERHVDAVTRPVVSRHAMSIGEGKTKMSTDSGQGFIYWTLHSSSEQLLRRQLSVLNWNVCAEPSPTRGKLTFQQYRVMWRFV